MQIYVHCNLNSLPQIAALENVTVDNVTKEEEKEVEEKEEGLNTDSHGSNATEITPTDPKPTDSPIKNKMVRLQLSICIHVKIRMGSHTYSIQQAHLYTMPV